MTDLKQALDEIITTRARVHSRRAVLAAVSGIDGCGKGFITAKLASALQGRGVAAVPINIDGWLNLPPKRFNPINPAEHFYLHAIRFPEMFERLVLPLRNDRSVRVVADFAEETATEYRSETYDYSDIEVILLEGIYLLKREFKAFYDLKIWIDCTFETALERAVARSQEGLPPEQTRQAYHSIYFPAQRIHFERDSPQAAARILQNDPRLEGVVTRSRGRELH